MTLEGGLDKLYGLKKMLEVSVECLATFIGVEEIQWMIPFMAQTGGC